MFQDIRLRALAGILIFGAFFMGGITAWNALTGNSWFVFGSIDDWENVYESPYNNISFKYPDGVEIITPFDEKDVPISVVLDGERGSSMLIQIGTLRREDIYTDVDNAISDYKQRFKFDRYTQEEIRHNIQGRGGVTLIQEEVSGRLVGETFFYDPATVVTPSRTGPDAEEYEIREVSLQLPDSSSARERKLYADLYLNMVNTISFLAEPNDVPEGFANTWQPFEVSESGFSLLYSPDWKVLDIGKFSGTKETVFATTYGDRNDSYAEYAISALPGTTDAAFLETAFAQPFRESAFPNTLEEENLTIPGVGDAISLQARVAKENPSDSNEIQTLLLIIGGGDTPQAKRGYVLKGRLPDGDNQQEVRLEQIRAMTKSFSLVSS